VSGAPSRPDRGVDRAALAYSLLPVRYADEVSHHLSSAERQRLRDALTRVRDAGDYDRVEAIRALSAAVRRGVVFPRPPGHDEHDCPVRRELWERLTADTRAFLTPRLAEVPFVRPNRTREVARDVNARLERVPR
jgi:hypothetical protein